MAALECIHLCDHGFLDESGKPCLIGISRYVLIRSLPYAMPRSTLAYSLTGAAQEMVALHLSVIDPYGNTIIDGDLDSVTVSEAGEVVGFVDMQGIVLSREGWHQIRLATSAQLAATLLVAVVVVNDE